MMHAPDTVKKVAVAMCEADGLLPYENTTMPSGGQTDVAMHVVRWMTYTAEATRFVAAMRALTLDQ